MEAKLHKTIFFSKNETEEGSFAFAGFYSPSMANPSTLSRLLVHALKLKEPSFELPTGTKDQQLSKVLQAFGDRLGLLRHSASRTEQLLNS